MIPSDKAGGRRQPRAMACRHSDRFLATFTLIENIDAVAQVKSAKLANLDSARAAIVKICRLFRAHVKRRVSDG
jgi:hypothetical protein